MPEKENSGLEADRNRRLFYFGGAQQWEPVRKEADRMGDSYASEEIFQKTAGCH